MPMAGLTLRRDLAARIADQSQPNTFAGNAVTAAACMTNIDLLTEHEGALTRRAADLGGEITARLREVADASDIIGDVRGRGLMIGIEMVRDKESRAPLAGEKVERILMGMLRRGVVMVPCGRFGNVFRFMPPLILTRMQAETAVRIFAETIGEAG